MAMAPTVAPDPDPHSTSLTDYEGKIDVAITALNFHDLYIFGGDAGASGMLANIYKLLKPGGTLGLIDHVGVAGQDNNALHRIEKSKVREFLTQTGFEIDGESNVLANPADDHTLHMRDESLDRNTDRMVIKAVKPAM
jgi:predicted methyltransferase